MDANRIVFEAVIESGPQGGAYVAVPFDVEKTFGQKRVKIKALIDGQPYRGLLVRMKTPFHILGVRKDIRQAIGKDIGDTVQVQLEEDKEERVVEVPDDLQEAMEQDPGVKNFFQGLSYTHRKEYVRWIESAKKTETRANRITKAIQMMKERKKGV